MEEKMKKHVTVVAAIQVGFAIIFLLGSFGSLLGLSIARSQVHDPNGEIVLKILFNSIPLFLGTISVLGLVGGIGLFAYKQWARYIVIVLAAMGLLAIPIGTLKGVYFLWVLLQSDTIRLFEKNEQRSAPFGTNL